MGEACQTGLHQRMKGRRHISLGSQVSQLFLYKQTKAGDGKEAAALTVVLAIVNIGTAQKVTQPHQA
jgi:hypothetical protein